MTAHRPKPTITPEIVERFAAYYSTGERWREFAPMFDSDDAHACGDAILALVAARPLNAEERYLANLLAVLTFSQRKRLGDKATALAAQRRAA